MDLPDISIDGLTSLPCRAQSAMGEGNPTHRARLHFASYMASRLRWFFPPDSVNDEEKKKHVDFITQVISEQGWVDFDEDYTRGQVESIVFGGSGNSGILLLAPNSVAGTPDTGDATVTYPAPSWLQGDYDGNGSFEDPRGVATFGVYRGHQRLIYQREIR